MENKTSKDRSTNFSREELNKLRELLEKYPVILNKKTDHASSKQKDEAWSKLTDEFNSTSTIYRTKKQLLYKFNNMKKIARKELSFEKKERRVTGGGPPPPKPSETSEWICSIMSESIVGLPSTYDSDITQYDHSENNQDTHNNAEMAIEEDIQLMDIPFLIEDSKTDIQFKDVADKETGTDIQENQVNKFDTSTPKAMLKKPISKQLETGRKNRLVCTPLETRKRIISMSKEKEVYIKKKGTREEKLLEFAEEEHRKNMKHKEKLNQIEIEFKNKINELMLKKASIEVQIEEEKLKKLQIENKTFID